MRWLSTLGLLASVTVLFVLNCGAIRAEPHGALVIVGGGTIPADVRAEFFKLAGGKDHGRIVVVPTASFYADDPQETDWFLKDWRELGAVSVQLLHTRDRQVANDPEFVKPLQAATAVWMSGGDQNRLIAAYRGTLVEKELHNVLKRGGVIGGTSAGAAAMSDPMIQGGDKDAKIGPGFGFMKDIVVDQHFVARNRIDRLRGVLSKNKEHAGLGIDEGTAAIVRGLSLTIKGNSTVTAIWPQTSNHPGKEKLLKAGDKLDLADLRATEFREPAESVNSAGL